MLWGICEDVGGEEDREWENDRLDGKNIKHNIRTIAKILSKNNKLQTNNPIIKVMHIEEAIKEIDRTSLHAEKTPEKTAVSNTKIEYLKFSKG